VNVSAPGYGSLEPSASNEYVFVYDITGANAATPRLKQVVKIPDTFEGLVFTANSRTFYVSGGADDVVYRYENVGGTWTQTAAISLGHQKLLGVTPASGGGIGFNQSPSAAGLALSVDGKVLAVANIYNESVSLIDTATNLVTTEYDLRPFNTSGAAGVGRAGGETPIAVAIAGNNTLYVSSIRDREVVVLDISKATPAFVTRIPMPGSPNSLVFDNPAKPSKLYVAQDNSDDVAVIDLATNRVIEQIDAIGPAGTTHTAERYTGAASNNLAISPDGQTLYVTNGGQNAVAVVPLAGAAPHKTAGLIPTGWYPHAVSVDVANSHLYVVNGKSDPGPNPGHLTGSSYALRGTTYPGGNNAAAVAADAANEYVLQLEKAGLLALPIPKPAELAKLTRQVAANNRYNAPETVSVEQKMQALSAKITHVIYIVKENRTFDQVLGDLKNGANGAASLAVFGARITPNFHAAGINFVTLDNFYDPGEVSGDGWEWSTAARETDLNTKQTPISYASSPTPTALNQGGRGAPYNAEGQNNDVDVGIPTTAQRIAAQPNYKQVTSAMPGGTDNFFPGANNDVAPDGPDGAAQMGYLWNSAVKAGLTVRNYGYYIDLGAHYTSTATPYKDHAVQAYASDPTLLTRTDPYFRSFDNNYPDLWRFDEWNREFQQFVKNGDLPNLTLLRYMHDHMGNFGSADNKKTGLSFPEAQQADDDLAVGKTLETIAHSPYAGNTLVFVVEDDSQDGPDHVNAHRSTAYIVGPYVKQGAVVSTRYNTVNMIRTIEDILRIDHLNLNDAYAAPMEDVFDLTQATWNFTAVASPFLRGTVDAVPGTKFADNSAARPARTAAWWAEQTKGFDWSKEDRVPAELFNRIIWRGFKGEARYPK
jgi:YVTN family beta-propeller protein